MNYVQIDYITAPKAAKACIDKEGEKTIWRELEDWYEVTNPQGYHPSKFYVVKQDALEIFSKYAPAFEPIEEHLELPDYDSTENETQN